MCGICGFFSRGINRMPAEEACASVQRMANALSHRGPDDAGAWVDSKTGLALGHRRLSILDLSAAGHQPMISSDGRYVLVLNGEIYNFRELREELEGAGHKFRGDSDTEVMLEEISRRGVKAALERFVGMFAFALWDRQELRLVLGRDRLGEKPLYFGWTAGTFVFGSELRSLKAFPSWEAEINPDAVTLLMAHKCVPAPLSIYRNIFKLPPGTFLSISAGEIDACHLPQPIPYWSLEAVAARAEQNPFLGDAGAATDELEHLLRASIAGQMVADVPVGAFLSGGVDSSTVVALMQVQSTRPIKTFSIGFDADGFDEAQHAKAVAKHLGTVHTELYVRPRELCDTVPELSRIYDEPLSDASQIPTVLLCRLARLQVTVSLSGDGGDELLGGYRHYNKTLSIWRSLRRLPRNTRASAGRFLGHSTTQALSTRLANSPALASLMNRGWNLSSLLGAEDLKGLYAALRLQCRQMEDWLLQPHFIPSRFTERTPWETVSNPLRQLMFADAISFLPEDILVKVDRAAMAVALETRIPLLDHRLVEFAWRLPISLLQEGKQGKWLLRQVLYRHVPRNLVDRPKRGFEPPIAQWLVGPLRPWAEELLSERRLRDTGLFHPQGVRRKWMEHLSQRRNWAQPLWSVLMFQAWLEREKSARGNPPSRNERTPSPVVNV